MISVSMYTFTSSFCRTSFVLGALAMAISAQSVQTVTSVANVGGSISGNGIISLFGPDYDAAGNLYFAGRLTGDMHFIAKNGAILWTNSMFSGLTGGIETFAASNAGFCYTLNINGNNGIFAKVGTNTNIVKKTDAAPGVPGYVIFNASSPRLTDNGTSFWRSTLTFNGGPAVNSMIYKMSPTGVVTPVIGSVSPFNIVGPDIVGNTQNAGSLQSMNISPNGLYTANVMNMDTGGTTDDGWLIVNGSVIAQEGLPWAGPAPISSYADVSVDNAGNVYYSGKLNAAANEDEYLARNAQPILLESDKIDNTSLSGLSLNEFDITRNGYMALFYNSGTLGNVLFIAKSDNPLGGKRVVGVGDQIDMNGDGGADAVVMILNYNAGRPVSISENREISMRITTTPIGGGPATESIVAIPYPKPGEVDRDGEVGPGDFERVNAAFGTGPSDAAWDAWADVDFDGEVGPSDFELIVNNFGS